MKKFLGILIISIIGIFAISYFVFGQALFDWYEGFEDYSIGNIIQSGSQWVESNSSLPEFLVENNYSSLGEKGMISPLGWNEVNRDFSPSIYGSTSGFVEFDFYVFDPQIDSGNTFRIFLQSGAGQSEESFTISPFYSSTSYKASVITRLGNNDLGFIENGKWYTIFWQYDDLRRCRQKLENNEWTEWLEGCDYPVPIKNIGLEPDSGVNCYGGTNDNCVRVIIDNIKNMLYSEPNCGSGYLCHFCLNETDCLNRDCYWQEEGGCLSNSPAFENDTTTNFDVFCNQYNYLFGTCSEMVRNWATSVRPFFQITSSFLISFSEDFNNTTGVDLGLRMGQAIPMLRGYLTFFNLLFNDFPVSEIFIFYLFILVVWGVLKIISLIKKTFFI